MDTPNSPQQRFPIVRAIGKFALRAVDNWRQRHQLPFNFWIHMIGIPVAVASLPLLFFDVWWGLAALFVGYLLQWIGHCAEGNDVGEFIPIKRLLGLPYVAIAPLSSRAGSSLPGATSAADTPGTPPR
jgi:hypothetical protein